MRPVTLTIAVLPPFPYVFEVEGGGPTPGLPWDELPHVAVAVEPDRTLRDALREACAEAGVRLTPDAVALEARWRDEQGLPPPSTDPAEKLVFVGFREPDDDVVVFEGDGPPVLARDTRLRRTTLVVQDDQGRAIWRKPGLDASIAELLAAAEAGLIDGDPRQPYLILTTPQGDLGGLDQWTALKDALVALWAVAGCGRDSQRRMGLH